MKLYSARHHHCRTEEYLWRGHRLVVLENELLRVAVVASKGADIIEFRYKPRDLDVLWHAPQALLPPGETVGTAAASQGHFLDYYAGGWQEVLPNAGPATTYRGAELGLHGEVAMLPWDYRVLDDRPERVELEFSVETRRTPFRLERRMALESGVPVISFEERVTNLGEEELAFAWGHHPAFGPPFLEAGCLIEMPPCSVVEPSYSKNLRRRFALERISTFPYMDNEAGEPARVDEVLGKDARTEDVVVFSGMNEGWYALRNPRLALAVGMVWDVKVFPYVWCWQVYGGSLGYPYYGREHIVALEPFNCPLLPLAECVDQRLAPVLAPAGHISTRLEAGIYEAGSKIGRIGFGGKVHEFSVDL